MTDTKQESTVQPCRSLYTVECRIGINEIKLGFSFNVYTPALQHVSVFDYCSANQCQRQCCSAESAENTCHVCTSDLCCLLSAWCQVLKIYWKCTTAKTKTCSLLFSMWRMGKKNKQYLFSLFLSANILQHGNNVSTQSQKLETEVGNYD